MAKNSEIKLKKTGGQGSFDEASDLADINKRIFDDEATCACCGSALAWSMQVVPNASAYHTATDELFCTHQCREQGTDPSCPYTRYQVLAGFTRGITTKYVVVDYGGLVKEVMFTFPESITHKDFAGKFVLPIISAGFIMLRDGAFLCHGNSVSLDKGSRPDDTDMANKYFSTGRS